MRHARLLLVLTALLLALGGCPGGGGGGELEIRLPEPGEHAAPPAPPEAEPAPRPSRDESGPEPSESLAVRAALDTCGEGTWHGAARERTEDWREAAIWCQADPSTYEDNYWVYEIGLRWRSGSGGYERVYTQFLSGEEVAGLQSRIVGSSEEGPSKLGALSAVTRRFESDWVTLVASRTRDWSRATVWAGPPESEYVGVVRVQWQPGRGYRILSEEPLEGDEMPPLDSRIVD